MTNRAALFRKSQFLSLLACGGLLLGLSGQPAHGQHYPTRTYTLRDGLPQMQVNCALADSRGYLWVGTKGGLAKFDGERFETFGQEDYGLPTDHIVSLAEDRRHRLWISTEAGLIRFDGGRFETFPFGPVLKNHHTLIHTDDHDRLWLLGNGRELWCFERGRFRRTQPFIRDLDSLGVTSFKWDNTRKRLWLTTIRSGNEREGQLCYLAGEHGQRLSTYQPPVGVELRLEEAAGVILLRETDPQSRTTLRWIPTAGHPKPFLYLDGARVRVIDPAPFDYWGMHNGRGYKVAAGSRVVEAVLESPGNLSNPNVRLGDKVFFPTEKGLIEVLDNGLRFFDEKQAPYVWSVIDRPNGDVWFLNYNHPPAGTVAPATPRPASGRWGNRAYKPCSPASAPTARRFGTISTTTPPTTSAVPCTCPTTWG